MKRKINFAPLSRTALLLGLIVACFAAAAQAQTTAFTYQGRFTDSTVAQPTNGNYNMQFALFDAASVSVGAAITVPSVQVVNGIFTVQLDFGAPAFPANMERLLEIRVFNTATAAYVPLSPRQPLTSAPFAIRSLNATTADNALNVGGTPAAQIIKEGDARLTDTRTPAAGSANYIQNQNAAAQTSTNFRIDGTGAADVFNAVTQFNIGGGRVLSVAGSDNTFAGFNTGTANTGISNSFFGRNAGSMNTGGGNNSFVGRDAGRNNSTGATNSFFGVNAGLNNLSGSENVFVGVQAGSANTTGGNNTIIGTAANVGANNLTFATAIGSGAVVSANNTVVLGRSSDTVQVPGNFSVAGTFNLPAGSANYIQNTTTQQASTNFNISGNGIVGGTLSANIVSAATQYNLGASRILGAFGTDNTVVGIGAGRITISNDNSFFGAGSGFFNVGGNFNSFFGESSGFNNSNGTLNSFFGASAGSGNTSGASNSFFGFGAGSSNQGGSNNVFLGNSAGNVNVSGSNNTIIGANANFLGGANNLIYATAIGADAQPFESNSIVLGRNNASDTVRIPGKVKLNTFGSAGAGNLCFNASLEISTCSSSLRYKTNIAPFTFGLNLVNSLQPITFDWKDGGMHDLGLGAEDVAAIEPLLVTYNKDGQIEGVKYDRIGVVLLNAVKEQQAQIEAQRLLIDELKKLVCAGNPKAAVCQ